MTRLAADPRSTPTSTELSQCDREPIHRPGSIQPHGVLLVVDSNSGRIQCASANASRLFSTDPERILACSFDDLSRLLPGFPWDSNWMAKSALPRTPALLAVSPLELAGQMSLVQLLSHTSGQGLILEFEIQPGKNAPELESSRQLFWMQETLEQLDSASSLEHLSSRAAQQVRQLTAYDRVLIYRFDEDGHGTVVGEDGNGRLPTLQNHRFPASDIPAQARELYRVHRTRMIPTSEYEPVPILATTDAADAGPLDLTFSVLRSVSPIHVQYMRNMETAASMSVSIVREGRLWGLISCHHSEPRQVPYLLRALVEVCARALALSLSTLETSGHYTRTMQMRQAYGQLLTAMADRSDFATAIMEEPQPLQSLVDAQGAAIVTNQNILRVGATPNDPELRRLAEWLAERGAHDVYHTASLGKAFPDLADCASVASGILAIRLSELRPSYLMWFRPEAVQHIPWGGNPHKPTDHVDIMVPLSPRTSFQTWMETLRGQSLPWQTMEIQAATELRSAIVGIILRKAEELAELTSELNRSNKELEAFSYSVSHDLRAPLRHIVGYAEVLRESGAARLIDNELRYIDVIIESSEYAGQLVEKLLNYSRLGRAELQVAPVDLNLLVSELRIDVLRDAANRSIEWTIDPLPRISADLIMLRMAVRDLLANAVKYTRGREVARIHIGCREHPDEWEIFVQDNGVGFDMQYVDKLFGVFQRLHRWEDFEGTGIGLANVRRVIERHGGRTWAVGEEGRGATIFFSWPKT